MNLFSRLHGLVHYREPKMNVAAKGMVRRAYASEDRAEARATAAHWKRRSPASTVRMFEREVRVDGGYFTLFVVLERGPE